MLNRVSPLRGWKKYAINSARNFSSEKDVEHQRLSEITKPLSKEQIHLSIDTSDRKAFTKSGKVLENGKDQQSAHKAYDTSIPPNIKEAQLE